VERRTRRGKIFYGCDNYPKCDYASWDKPLPQPCPQCGHPFLLQKKTKTGETIRCPNQDCGYTQD
jgi:DNA topoisomerase-1